MTKALTVNETANRWLAWKRNVFETRLVRSVISQATPSSGDLIRDWPSRGTKKLFRLQKDVMPVV